ncbi:MAG: alpha/beta fold hydrolase [Egibacteraceae bacterium]
MLQSFGNPPIFAQVHGGWPPSVVALHGWGRDRGDFRAALRGLCAVAVDLPGFGASPAPSRSCGSQEYAERVAEVLHSIENPVVLVGHSFGGRVAVRLAAMEPDAVRALVLTGAPIAAGDQPRRTPALGYRAIRALHRTRIISDDALERARRRYGSADYRRADGVMRDVLVTVLHEDYQEDLRRLSQPLLLMWGEDDTEVPLAVAQRACRIAKSCTLETVPGVGHGLPWQAPDRLRAAILAMSNPPVGS